MGLEYLLLILIPLAAIAYIVWNYRRKMGERDATRAGRMHELLGAAAQAQPLPTMSNPSSPSPDGTVMTARIDEGSAAPSFSVRSRVLTPPQTLLYFLLRTGLPEHVIFARPALALLLEPAPGLTDSVRQDEMRRLAAVTVDFVVADRSMRPLAVVELRGGDEARAGEADRASARTRLAAAGVRYIELDPNALPRKEAIRAVVLEGLRPESVPTNEEQITS